MKGAIKIFLIFVGLGPLFGLVTLTVFMVIYSGNMNGLHLMILGIPFSYYFGGVQAAVVGIAASTHFCLVRSGRLSLANVLMVSMLIPIMWTWNSTHAPSGPLLLGIHVVPAFFCWKIASGIVRHQANDVSAGQQQASTK